MQSIYRYFGTRPRRARRSARVASAGLFLGARRCHPRLGDAAGCATVDAAYTSYVEDLTTAWKSPERRAQDVLDAQRVTADAQPMSARDAYIAETTNAWRGRDADQVTGAPTQAMETMPAGAYIKVGLGAVEGDTVTWNGAPAVLRRRGDWLFPEVINVGPTRATPTNRGADSMTGDRSVIDAAWLALQQETANAWKSPP